MILAVKAVNKSTAKLLTPLYEKFVTGGYELENVCPQHENGDLEGFFVLYKRFKIEILTIHDMMMFLTI